MSSEYSPAEVEAARNRLVARGIAPGSLPEALNGATVTGIAATAAGLRVDIDIAKVIPDGSTLAECAPQITRKELGIDPSHIKIHPGPRPEPC